MNHFLGLLILSLCIATVFSLVNRSETTERIKYFLTLMGYMVVGSLLFAWLMYLLA
ncbi:MAG: hypothetical protein JSU96_20780 [Acidobacteriota bacterium]|nr:MAG: hypothetical protein JSU96_20780 [Acidobacteriota bacterium]